MSENDRDVLLSKVADGEAGEGDWAAFRTLADADPVLWRDLAELQRDNTELSAAVGRVVMLADSVEAPADTQIVARLGDRLRLVATWGGWAAAAMVAVAWVTGQGQLPRSTPATGNQAGLATFSPSEAYQAYLDRGKQAGLVVDEMPDKYVLDTRPLPGDSGRIEVFYVRQILERAVVDGMYRQTQDELGRTLPLKIEIRASHPAVPPS
jgi:hypothetical protein